MIEQLGPEWAKGCDQCSYGIVSAPPLTRTCNLHMERLIQAMDKQLVFCACQAGTRYRVYLLNCRQRFLEEANRLAPTDLRMAAAAMQRSHPDIDIARWHVERGREQDIDANIPTIHFEEATV